MDSMPGYLRPSSRGNYVRDNSSYRRGSNVRAGLLPGEKFTGPSRNNSKSGGRVQSKTPERKDDNLYMIVKNLEKGIK